MKGRKKLGYTACEEEMKAPRETGKTPLLEDKDYAAQGVSLKFILSHRQDFFLFPLLQN